MSTTYLWRGHQGPEFRALFDACFARGDLLIACPPAPVPLDFVDLLPEGPVRAAGELTDGAVPARQGAAPVYPERPVLGVFTSGSTRATPKLVLFSKKNIEATFDAILALFDRSRVDAVFCYPQPYHVFGLILGCALAKARGLRFHAADGAYGRQFHAAWAELAEANLITLAVPSQMNDLCAWLEINRKTPRPTYAAILGGAAVDRATWRRARDVARIEAPSVGYGCTEASPAITHLPPGVEPRVDGDIGYRLPHVAMAFSENPGFTIRGPAVCLATIEAGRLVFPTSHDVPDDLSRDADGRYAFVARTDLVLNRGGEKFGLEGLETELRVRIGVEALCVAVPDARLGDELGVLVEAQQGLGSDDVVAALAAAYPRRIDPRRVAFVDRLPRSYNGKLDRRAAAALLTPPTS